MKNFVRICLLFGFLLSLGQGPLFAQQKAVEYTRDFEFKEGVYLSFNDFRNNKPVPKEKIVFNSNKNDKDFLKYALDKATFVYTDTLGKEQEVKTDNAWGFCSNGAVYINHGTDFNRVTVIGSICHFIATVPMRVGVSDPFYNNDPFYNPQQYTYVSNQYVLDFETGKVIDFSVDNMDLLLKKDETLSKEFSALKNKQKRDGIFLYLRKFNAKYPIFFPEG